MLSFAKARQLAELWIKLTTDGRAELVRGSVQAKPYGWVFFYQSSAFLKDPDNRSLALAGNAPFIVDRRSGEIRVLRTGAPLDASLTEYERTLPPAALYAKPEPPNW